MLIVNRFVVYSIKNFLVRFSWFVTIWWWSIFCVTEGFFLFLSSSFVDHSLAHEKVVSVSKTFDFQLNIDELFLHFECVLFFHDKLHYFCSKKSEQSARKQSGFGRCIRFIEVCSESDTWPITLLQGGRWDPVFLLIASLSQSANNQRVQPSMKLSKRKLLPEKRNNKMEPPLQLPSKRLLLQPNSYAIHPVE